jgi:hypothetical protein
VFWQIEVWACGLGGVIVALGLYSYFVRQLMAAVVLLGGACLFLTLVLLGSFFILYAGTHAVIWAWSGIPAAVPLPVAESQV